MSATAAKLSNTVNKPVTPVHRVFNPTYTAYDLRRNLRMFSNLFFVIILPVVMYLIFGAIQEYATGELASGRGNVSAQIMVSMAAYGAIVATSGLAGSAAVELQQGWGRQLALTPFSKLGYVVSKTIVALTIAILPILAVFLGGGLTTARMDAGVWLLGGVLVLGASVVFALYGLAFGLIFRSESAVGAASGLVVILMFLGNAFVPLSGFLLDLAPFTPVWGVMQLGLWPLTDGIMYVGMQGDGSIQYAIWQPVLNIIVWAAAFGLLALWGARRGTGRR